MKLGAIRATEGFELTFFSQRQRPDLGDYLKRHATGDYGLVDYDTRVSNAVIARNLEAGGYVISEYQFPDGERFQIATNRRETVFQLPDEW